MSVYVGSTAYDEGCTILYLLACYLFIIIIDLSFNSILIIEIKYLNESKSVRKFWCLLALAWRRLDLESTR